MGSSGSNDRKADFESYSGGPRSSKPGNPQRSEESGSFPKAPGFADADVSRVDGAEVVLDDDDLSLVPAGDDPRAVLFGGETSMAIVSPPPPSPLTSPPSELAPVHASVRSLRRDQRGALLGMMALTLAKIPWQEQTRFLAWNLGSSPEAVLQRLSRAKRRVGIRASRRAHDAEFLRECERLGLVDESGVEAAHRLWKLTMEDGAFPRLRSSFLASARAELDKRTAQERWSKCKKAEIALWDKAGWPPGKRIEELLEKGALLGIEKGVHKFRYVANRTWKNIFERTTTTLSHNQLIAWEEFLKAERAPEAMEQSLRRMAMAAQGHLDASARSDDAWQRLVAIEVPLHIRTAQERFFDAALGWRDERLGSASRNDSGDLR